MASMVNVKELSGVEQIESIFELYKLGKDVKQKLIDFLDCEL